MADESSLFKPAKVISRKDVAELAGVAPTTVSLVLNENPGTRIPASTRERVIAAAHQLNYQPNQLARALKTGRNMNIGVVLHYAKHPFSSYVSRMLDGIWARGEEKGYRLCIASGQKEHCLGKMFRERSVDGIVVLASPYEADDAELRDAIKSRFPLVFLGAKPQKHEVDYVDIDNVAAGRWATEQLIAKGHRRILHLAGPQHDNSSAVERYRGYLEALRDAGIDASPELVLEGSYNTSVSHRAVFDALQRRLEFSAIFAANHYSALGAQKALVEQGFGIPQDISIASIDRFGFEENLGASIITRLELPLQPLGIAAFEFLYKRMLAPTDRVETLYLEPEVIAGSSIATVKI